MDITTDHYTIEQKDGWWLQARFRHYTVSMVKLVDDDFQSLDYDFPNNGRFVRFRDVEPLIWHHITVSNVVNRSRFLVNEYRIQFISENCFGLWSLCPTLKYNKQVLYKVDYVFEQEADALLFKMRFGKTGC